VSNRVCDIVHRFLSSAFGQVVIDVAGYLNTRVAEDLADRAAVTAFLDCEAGEGMAQAMERQRGKLLTLPA
jgi:hypothetical protein